MFFFIKKLSVLSRLCLNKIVIISSTHRVIEILFDYYFYFIFFTGLVSDQYNSILRFLFRIGSVQKKLSRNIPNILW